MGETPKGWFQDPENADLVRYWDGRAWTDMRRQPHRGENPPSPPPQQHGHLSPDGLWQWNGSQWVSATPPSGAVPVKSKQWPVFFVVGGVVLAGLAFVGSLVPSDSGGSSRETAATEADWIPPGFDPSSDADLAWRWKITADLDCSYYDACAAIEVAARRGCPSGVYVEMAKVDGAGVLGDRSNEIGPAMQAGERAFIRVGWLGGGEPGKVKVTQLSCMR